MNKEIRLSLSDLYIGYACAAFLMYAIGGIAYTVGKTKAKIEISETIRKCVEDTESRSVAK